MRDSEWQVGLIPCALNFILIHTIQIVLYAHALKVFVLIYPGSHMPITIVYLGHSTPNEMYVCEGCTLVLVRLKNSQAFSTTVSYMHAVRNGKKS